MQIHKYDFIPTIFLTEDALSISNLHGFIKSLQQKSSHVFEKTHEKGLMLRKA